MTDKQTDNKRLWFEFDSEGRVHMDSLDPSHGGQITLTLTLRAFQLMMSLITESIELAMERGFITSESDKEWGISMIQKLDRAHMDMFKKSLSSLGIYNVGIRKGWE